MNNPASNFEATPAGGGLKYLVDIQMAIEGFEPQHFTLFTGGVTKQHCVGCGQLWPCRTERLKRDLIAEFRRLKKLESDHV